MQLHAISPAKEEPKDFLKKALSIYDLVDFIHLRNRHWTAAQFQYILDSMRKLDESLSKVIINDRIDIAQVNGVQRVHLPSHGIQPRDMKRFYPHLTFGTSIHELSEAKVKEDEGANYLIFGHVYETESKAGLAPRGLKQLSEVTRATRLPVIAIGGIRTDRVSEVKQAGAKGIAVLSSIFNHRQPRDQALYFREAIIKAKEDVR